MKYLIVPLMILMSCSSSSYKEYYPDGSLKSEYELRDDGVNKVRVYHGVGRKYYKNGALAQESNWVDGNKHGISMTYYVNGNIEIKAHFQNGEQTGWAYYYDSLGNLRGKSYYLNSKIVGDFEEYYPNGRLSRRGTISSGESNMRAFEFFESGMPKQCYIKINDTTVYHKTYSESGVNLFTNLPVSINQLPTTICFNLEYSIYEYDSLVTRVHIGDVSEGKPKIDHIQYESIGNTVCISKGVLKNTILEGYICEIERRTNSYQGWMQFYYDIQKDSFALHIQ